jgi:hypothetical protein
MEMKMKTIYTESEVQGRGRRYWFIEQKDAETFCEQKKAKGYRAVRDGNTVWVPFAKKMNSDTRMQQAGMDTI